MQPQQTATTTDWVSFDDDSGGFGFRASAASSVAASAAPASASNGWGVRFDAPGPPLAQQPYVTQLPTPPVAAVVALGVPTVAAAAAVPGPRTVALAPSPPAAQARAAPTTPNLPISSAAPPKAFPSFAALHGATTSATPGATSTITTMTDPAPVTAAGSSVHRLPRPPTSVSRGGAAPTAHAVPVAAAANPFVSQPAIPPPPAPAMRPPAGASSNPFAATANPQGATAASRSLDPFADLSVRPALPRPPPMAAARGSSPATSPPMTSSLTPSPGPGAATAGSTPAGVLLGVPGSAGAERWSGGVVGLSSSRTCGTWAAAGSAATAPRSNLRPPTAVPAPPTAAPALQPPAMADAPGSGRAPAAVAAAAASSSVFPSFADLYQQQHQPVPGPPVAAALYPHPRTSPHVAAAAAVSSPVAAAITPQSSSGWCGYGSPPTQGQGYRQGVTETVAVSTFLSSAHQSPTAPQAPADAIAGAVQPQMSPTPPPPPYSVAVSLPSAAISLLDGGMAAASPGLPPPPPYVEALDMPDAQPPSHGAPPPPYDEAVSFPAGGAEAIAGPSLNHTAMPLPNGDAPPPPGSWAVFEDDPLIERVATGLPAPEQPRPLPASRTASSSLASISPPSASYASPAHKPPSAAPPPDQICVEVRLPPLKPKEAAWPKRLAAGMGLLFAAPGGEGVAMLQWWLQPGPGPTAAAGEGAGPRFALSAGADAQYSSEDADSAPAASVPLPLPLYDLPLVRCLLLDDVSGSLWTGHKDGRVVRWSVQPGRVAVYEHHWKAHVRGKITSMTLSPWGDLWTASSAGTIRAWQYPAGVPGSRSPTKLFECRRCRLSMGPAARTAAQRAHSKAKLLCLGPGGRVVWSAGRTGLALWGAYDGEFLGTLAPGVAQEARAGPGAASAAAAAAGAYAGDTGALSRDGGSQQQMEINPLTGLSATEVNRAFSPRLPLDPSEEGELGELDRDLGQQVFKGLAGAAKLAVRLGKKIRQNFTDSTGAGSAADAIGASDLHGSSPGGRGKVVALLPCADQSVFAAYERGVLDKYTEWGRLLWSRDYGRGVQLCSAAVVGALLWLGCGDGAIRTASVASGELGASWRAHDFPVVDLAHDVGSTQRGSALVYSLSENGSVRGWPAVLPTEAQLLAWRDGLLPSLRPHRLTVLAATWNVNETRPAPQSLRTWLQPAEAANIVSISLQEVEVGTSSVARDAAVTFLSKAALERGNQNAQWWSTELSAALLAATGSSWARVALRQMSGLVIVVFCREELQPHIGEVATANVACGVMGVGGNKGAVAVSMSVFRRRVMFVCSHFAAHQERVDERNENYNRIVRLLHFDNTSKAAQQQQQLRYQQQPAGEAFVDGMADFDIDSSAHPSATAPSGAAFEAEADGHGPGLSDAVLLVWSGDFNYRIKGSYEEVVDWACSGALRQLYQMDQCRIEMERGTIFRGLREPLPLGHPVFVPTYKYDKGEPHMWLPLTEPGGRGRLRLPFDTSEKRRVPAWTDRVFYRGSRPGTLDVAEEEVLVSISRPSDYNCVLDVLDSDHKPVYALLQVQLPGYEQEQKRQHSLASALAVHQAALTPPGGTEAARQLLQFVRTSVSRLELRPRSTTTLDLINDSSSTFTAQIMTERRPDAAPGGKTSLHPLPGWLEVSPTTFELNPKAVQRNGSGTSPAGYARIFVRVLEADFHRPTEPLQLRFVLRPVWGSETLAATLGPFVTVMVR